MKVLKLLILTLTILLGPVKILEVEVGPIPVTSTESITETRGKKQMTEPAQTEAPKEVITEDTSRQESEEVLKII